MKKIVMLPLLAALSLGAAACSKSGDTANSAVANDVTLNSEEIVSDDNSAGFDANATALDGNTADFDDLGNATATNSQ